MEKITHSISAKEKVKLFVEKNPYRDGESKLVAAKTHKPAKIYLFKINDRNSGKRCEICSKSTIKTPERRQ